MIKQDIAIVIDTFTGERDIAVGTDGDLLATTGFDTSVENSLLVNRRAAPQEITAPYYARGWIGDLATRVLGFQVGSKIWLLEQRRLTPQVITEIEDAAQKSLEWLIEEGAASNVITTVDQFSPHSVRLAVDIYIAGVPTRRFVNLWNRTAYGEEI